MTGKKPSRCLRGGLLLILIVAVAVGATLFYQARVRSRASSYLREARNARAEGRWRDLQRLAEKWTAWDRSCADAWLFRADAAQQQGDFASAAKFLQAVPESDPKALPSLVTLSTLQFGALNRPFDGVETCGRILRLEPRTTAAHQQLIEFYALSLQRQPLERQIRWAIENSREPPMAYIYLFLIDTMRLATGTVMNSRWLKEEPGNELLLVANVLQLPEPESGIRNDAGDDKYTLVDSLFQRFPANIELLAYKVDMSIRRGNVDELIGLLRNLPANADSDCRFWRAKGWLHLARDEISKSRQALEYAIELYPLDWNARNWLADALRREGSLVEAESLHEIVQVARSLRARITAMTSIEKVPPEILADIADFARRCGDKQVAEALSQRLQRQ